MGLNLVSEVTKIKIRKFATKHICTHLIIEVKRSMELVYMDTMHQLLYTVDYTTEQHLEKINTTKWNQPPLSMNGFTQSQGREPYRKEGKPRMASYISGF